MPNLITYNNGNQQLLPSEISGIPPIGSVIYIDINQFNLIPDLPDNWEYLDGQLYLNPKSPFHNTVLKNVNGNPTGADTFSNGKISVFIRGGLDSGTYEEDAFQGHDHTKGTDQPRNYIATQDGSNAASLRTDPSKNSQSGYISDGINGIPRVSDQTQPKNTTMRAIIRTY